MKLVLKEKLEKMDVYACKFKFKFKFKNDVLVMVWP